MTKTREAEKAGIPKIVIDGLIDMVNNIYLLCDVNRVPKLNDLTLSVEVEEQLETLKRLDNQSI